MEKTISQLHLQRAQSHSVSDAHTQPSKPDFPPLMLGKSLIIKWRAVAWKSRTRPVFVPLRFLYSLLLPVNYASVQRQHLRAPETIRGTLNSSRWADSISQSIWSAFKCKSPMSLVCVFSRFRVEWVNAVRGRAEDSLVWCAKMMTPPFRLSGGATFPIKLCWLCFTRFDSICKRPFEKSDSL